MKAISVLTAAAIAAVCITGCSGQANPQPAGGTTPASTPTPAAAPATTNLKIGDICNHFFTGEVNMLSEYQVAVTATNASDYLLCAIDPGHTATAGDSPQAKIQPIVNHYGFEALASSKETVHMCPENLKAVVDHYSHPQAGASKQLNPQEYGLVLDLNHQVVGAIYFSKSPLNITALACHEAPQLSDFSRYPDNPK